MSREIDAATAIRQVENWLQVAGRTLIYDQYRTTDQKIAALRAAQAVINEGFEELIGRLTDERN